MKRKIVAGAGFAAALALGFVALTGFAGGCGHHRGHGDPAQTAAFVNARVDDLLDDVDATPDQRTRIHAIAQKLVADGQKLHAENKGTHETLLAEWKAEQPDRAKLHALVDARIDALRAFAHEAVDSGVEAHGVLTPPQREKLTKKAERWHR
jgi:Spy/CpxP family protein refolding chaperone